MQLLFIHSDYIEYEAKEKTGVAEPIEEAKKKEHIKEVLVVFVAVESEDERDKEYVINKAVEEISSVLDKVSAEKIILYPYAHLSSDLASPEQSIEILKLIEKKFAAIGVEVKRAPFGWYKSFTLRCKGHPLAELSKKIEVPMSRGRGEAEKERIEEEKEKKSEALIAEKKVKSHFFFMVPSEERLVEPVEFRLTEVGDENLWKFFLYESEKRREVDKIPPHVELMRRLEIADYESSSDPGNLRFYPKGALIKGLLEAYVRNVVKEYGAMEVETPVMYSAEHPSLKNYVEKFPARQYSLRGKRASDDLFLRFAACFGQFLMGKDMSISYKNLPLKIFELASSFRREKRGELVGLRRLRSFIMPDMHTFCKDIEEALEEFKKQYEFCMRVLEGIGLFLDDYEVAIRFTKDFYEKHKWFIEELVKIMGKPVLIEMWDRRYFYFVLKFEFNFVDAFGKASALSTVQIDVENAERYGIRYVDANNEEKYLVILHCSPSGAIERCMYVLLEKAYLSLSMEKGFLPLSMLPLWLSPTQLRIIPVAERHLEFIKGLLPALQHVRVDVDDREETMSKKIRDAGREWIPYVAVVGDKEVKGKTLNVTIRKESCMERQKMEEMDVVELKSRIEGAIKEYPFLKLPLPLKLSERPRFVGA